VQDDEREQRGVQALEVLPALGHAYERSEPGPVVTQRDSVVVGFEAGSAPGHVKKGGVLLSLGPIEPSGNRVEVETSLWINGLAGQWADLRPRAEGRYVDGDGNERSDGHLLVGEPLRWRRQGKHCGDDPFPCGTRLAPADSLLAVPDAPLREWRYSQCSPALPSSSSLSLSLATSPALTPHLPHRDGR
jgi:hypothetical protein